MDSEEMLDYINKSKSFDAGIAYHWSRQFVEVLAKEILNGRGDVASLVGQYEGLISTAIETTMSAVYQD